MSLTKNTALTLTALSSLALVTHPVAASTSIGIHFQGGDGSLVQGSAGAVVQTTTWNNLTGMTNVGSTDEITYNNSNPNPTLEDSTGANSGVTITYSSVAEPYQSKSANSDPNTALMSGYLDTDNTTPITVTASGISYSTYDVYVYSLGDTSNRGASYTIGGTTYYLNSDNPTFGAGFAQVTNTSSTQSGGIYSGANATGNYMEFTGLTGSSFMLTATPTYQNVSAARAPVNGIQIVDASAAPEPSQIGMIAAMGLGLGGLLLRARKRGMTAA